MTVEMVESVKPLITLGNSLICLAGIGVMALSSYFLLRGITNTGNSVRIDPNSPPVTDPPYPD